MNCLKNKSPDSDMECKELEGLLKKVNFYCSIREIYLNCINVFTKMALQLNIHHSWKTQRLALGASKCRWIDRSHFYGNPQLRSQERQAIRIFYWAEKICWDIRQCHVHSRVIQCFNVSCRSNKSQFHQQLPVDSKIWRRNQGKEEVFHAWYAKI